MRLLIVNYDNTGKIIDAKVEDVLNEATVSEDGGLLLSDGRLHRYNNNIALFDVDVLTNDVLCFARDGKYQIVNGELYLNEEWTPGG